MSHRRRGVEHGDVHTVCRWYVTADGVRVQRRRFGRYVECNVDGPRRGGDLVARRRSAAIRGDNPGESTTFVDHVLDIASRRSSRTTRHWRATFQTGSAHRRRDWHVYPRRCFHFVWPGFKDLVSRVQDLRFAAREFVDLLCSSSTQGRRRSDVVSRVRDLRRADGDVEETMSNSAESRSPQCHRRTCEHAISNAGPTAFA